MQFCCICDTWKTNGCFTPLFKVKLMGMAYIYDIKRHTLRYMVFVMREYPFLKNKVCLYFLWTTGSFFATDAQYTTCFWVAHIYLEIIHFLPNPPLGKCLCNFDILLIFFYFLTNGCPQPTKINVAQRVGTIKSFFFTQINSWIIIHKSFTDEWSSGNFLMTLVETQKM